MCQAYLNKPAAFSCIFFQVWMTFYATLGAEGLSKETDIIAEV